MRPKFIGAVTWEALRMIAKSEALEADEKNDHKTQCTLDRSVVELLGMLTRLAKEVRA